jgi:peptidoglycan/xylan/chitin deacetylase (PgdA/CDA1 family)
MAALDRAGYTAVRLDRVLAAWAGRGRLPPRPIVVSFDDGHLGHARYAAPVLRRLGWPGVLNLELDNVGDDGLPSWGVRRLLRDGWEIASHTISHPDLRTLGPRELRRELRTSRRLLRERLGVRTRVLCYPAGKYDARVVRAARAAGYVAATTVREGVARPADPRLELPRVRADGDLAPRVLLRRLRAYGRANARAVPSAIATQRSTHP